MTEQRRLAAIVSADVAGYSRLMGRDETGTLAALKSLRQEVVDPAIAAHGGRIVKTTGDGLLLEFPSVVNAVRCAVEMHREREITDGVALARRAVAFGMDDPIALVTGGAALATLAGELDSAIAYVDRAIVLNPNLALAWSVSGWGRAYLSDHANAIVRLERAIRLSPFDLLAHHFYTGMGWAHLFAGRYDEAASWARKAALEKPDWAPTARVEAIACALSGRIVKAREALARMRALDPNLKLSNAGGKNWRRAEDRALYIEGLRRAGLPE